MKTFLPKVDAIERKWFVVDASEKILGRFASKVARILSGRNKPIYTPFMETGDFVVVINAEKIKVTGKKFTDKMYYRYSGYTAGLSSNNFKEMIATHPDRVITEAVKGMLPKNRLARQMLKNLKVYKGGEHPHQAQKPEVINL